MLSYVSGFYKELELYFKRVIHPRRLIISSEKKVMQFPISVSLQVCILLMLACGIIWSTYATARFISTKYKLAEQHKALVSVTAQKTNILSSLYPTGGLPKESTDNLLIMQNKQKMAVLQRQVEELKNENEIIISRVREKTDGQLDDLESIVSQTGLNPDSIQKKAAKTLKAKDDAEGGPYIPTEMPSISDEASEMLDSLEKLRTMRQIVANLPLGLPIQHFDEHSQFGHRIDPFNGNIAFHSGLDLAGPSGSRIRSTADGVVASAGRDSSYGNMVDINHGFGVVTRYAHLSEIKVSKGMKVKKGDLIGIQGSTGRSTGPHLHYEVRYNGEAINPQKFLQTGRLLELGNVSQNQN